MGMFMTICIDADMAGPFAYLVEKENNAQDGILGVQILYNPFLSEIIYTVYIIMCIPCFCTTHNAPTSYLTPQQQSYEVAWAEGE